MTAVVELRSYVTQPGRRDELIDLVEREFIEEQEACGMLPIAHFRDPAHPDRYVWLRGFPEMSQRRAALHGFYRESPIWQAHRDAANATMIDSDDVLMLRPATPRSGFDLSGLERRAYGERDGAGVSFVGIAVVMLRHAAETADLEAFERTVLPQVERVATRVACYVTDERENEFPALPVRTEPAFVVIGACANRDRLAAMRDALRPERLPEGLRAAATTSDFLELEPAARSLYR